MYVGSESELEFRYIYIHPHYFIPNKNINTYPLIRRCSVMTLLCRPKSDYTRATDSCYSNGYVRLSWVWDVIRAKTTPHIVYDAHHTQNCTVWGPDRCKSGRSGPHTGRMCRSCQNSRRHTDVISKFLYFFIIRRSS